ncbi:outer membrane lipoprotein carrier protein LolA [Telmatospirillum sp.]|uniref:LolA family protein n=1 Tax=Telmatospirillum sp. TaxID=2079197 RepID=UPI00284AE094|nr:outer membrane lipoprotein carrier protein LolA [Telmatospirillum sp.]MDR3439579.1 outer membrane lipoprotein carrier protein LolA [Telmatospirillum sp.]
MISIGSAMIGLVNGTAKDRSARIGRTAGWIAALVWCFAALACVTGLTAGAAVAAVTPDKAELNKQDIDKAEAYLNAVTTLKARFMQVSPDGSTAEGTVMLWRPGRLRLDYDAPSPIQVIADGTFLIYYDKQLKQVSYVDLDSTPAGILVRPKVKLEGADLKVVKVFHQPGVINVSIVKADDPGQGRIMLVFTESPYQLRQWQVTDPQGQVTTVSLFEAETGISFDKELFRFKDPSVSNGPDLSNTDK